MMRKIGRVITISLAIMLASSCVSYAKDYDLPNMTSAELEELKKQIEDEIDTNHDTTYEEDSKIEEASKKYVESVYGEDNVDWAWID